MNKYISLARSIQTDASQMSFTPRKDGWHKNSTK